MDKSTFEITKIKSSRKSITKAKKSRRGDSLLTTIVKIITATLGGGILFMSDNIIKCGLLNNLLGAGFITILALIHNLLYYLSSDRALKEDEETYFIHNQNNTIDIKSNSQVIYIHPISCNISEIDPRNKGYVPLSRSELLVQLKETENVVNELSLKKLAFSQANRFVGYYTAISTSISCFLGSNLFLLKFSKTWTNLISYIFNLSVIRKTYLQIITNCFSFILMVVLLKVNSKRFQKFSSFAGISIIFVLTGFLVLINWLNGWDNSKDSFMDIPGVFDFSLTKMFKSMSKLLFALNNQFALPRIISNMSKRTGTRFFTATATASASLVAFYMSIGSLGAAILGQSHKGDLMEGLLNFEDERLIVLYTRSPFIKLLSLSMNGLYTMIFLSASYCAAYEPFMAINSLDLKYPEMNRVLKIMALFVYILVFFTMCFYDNFNWNIITDIFGVISTPYISHVLPALTNFFYYFKMGNIMKAGFYLMDTGAMISFQGLLGYLVFFKSDSTTNNIIADRNMTLMTNH